MRRGACGALALLLAAPLAAAADPFARPRRDMVAEQIRARGVAQPDVLRAMEQVPRHLFAPRALQEQAYADSALSLGSGRSIYQPYIVAVMTELLDLDRDDKVLEVGTGSGYHAAVLSRIARQVYSIEIDPGTAQQAIRRLGELGYRNVEVRVGDGYQGWQAWAPYDAILLSAAPPGRVPQPLLDQLRVGGKMVAPIGEFFQDLLVITKTADGLEKRSVIPVVVSPMTGRVRDVHRQRR
ncbi:MAG TPA: protein-L-isoaspartate(D-aspartate) O-methyltransferase [Thermoanaerobaculia bacterium]|nr:protein-L-isoaspartate(D-aspartate) O-methyltransferase [Thermoanaerobaculia bacterium]